MENQVVDKVLKSCGAIITYVPLRSEVPFRDFVAIPAGKAAYEIAPRAALDPLKEAAAARAAAAGARACVLMPGRKFDTAGTRFGQGGGWYDRFLAEVPREWLRIGFCYDYQFSEEPLERMEWDQVMDVVCVVNKETQELVVHETHARDTLDA